MLYSEFVEATGCRETDKNYQVYKELEIIYMNTDCTKEHIYELGRKLVDNSKTEDELAFEKEINDEIQNHKDEIKKYKEWISIDEESLSYWKQDGDKKMIALFRNNINYWKQEIREHKNQINALKWVLN